MTPWLHSAPGVSSSSSPFSSCGPSRVPSYLRITWSKKPGAKFARFSRSNRASRRGHDPREPISLGSILWGRGVVVTTTPRCRCDNNPRVMTYSCVIVDFKFSRCSLDHAPAARSRSILTRSRWLQPWQRPVREPFCRPIASSLSYLVKKNWFYVAVAELRSYA